MKSISKNIKRTLALTLVIVMMLGMIPLMASAATDFGSTTVAEIATQRNEGTTQALDETIVVANVTAGGTNRTIKVDVPANFVVAANAAGIPAATQSVTINILDATDSGTVSVVVRPAHTAAFAGPDAGRITLTPTNFATTATEVTGATLDLTIVVTDPPIAGPSNVYITSEPAGLNFGDKQVNDVALGGVILRSFEFHNSGTGPAAGGDTLAVTIQKSRTDTDPSTDFQVQMQGGADWTSTITGAMTLLAGQRTSINVRPNPALTVAAEPYTATLAIVFKGGDTKYVELSVKVVANAHNQSVAVASGSANQGATLSNRVFDFGDVQKSDVLESLSRSIEIRNTGFGNDGAISIVPATFGNFNVSGDPGTPAPNVPVTFTFSPTAAAVAEWGTAKSWTFGEVKMDFVIRNAAGTLPASNNIYGTYTVRMNVVPDGARLTFTGTNASGDLNWNKLSAYGANAFGDATITTSMINTNGDATNRNFGLQQSLTISNPNSGRGSADNVRVRVEGGKFEVMDSYTGRFATQTNIASIGIAAQSVWVRPLITLGAGTHEGKLIVSWGGKDVLTKNLRVVVVASKIEVSSKDNDPKAAIDLDFKNVQIGTPSNRWPGEKDIFIHNTSDQPTTVNIAFEGLAGSLFTVDNVPTLSKFVDKNKVEKIQIRVGYTTDKSLVGTHSTNMVVWGAGIGDGTRAQGIREPIKVVIEEASPLVVFSDNDSLKRADVKAPKVLGFVDAAALPGLRLSGETIYILNVGAEPVYDVVVTIEGPDADRFKIIEASAPGVPFVRMGAYAGQIACIHVAPDGDMKAGELFNAKLVVKGEGFDTISLDLILRVADMKQVDAIEEYVTGLYEFFFDRKPAESEWMRWTNFLLDEKTTLASLVNGFLFSEEYQKLLSGLNDRGFVLKMYGAFFGTKRVVAESELERWVALLEDPDNPTTRETISLGGFSDSEEFEKVADGMGIKAK